MHVTATRLLDEESERIKAPMASGRRRNGVDRGGVGAFAPSARQRRRSESRRSRKAIRRHTLEFWRKWSDRCVVDVTDKERVYRSALVLKALTYAPTGAVIAAPTTSLPELLGGERNWDYRYTWIRDGTLTLISALSRSASERRPKPSSSGWSARARGVPRTFRSCTASAASDSFRARSRASARSSRLGSRSHRERRGQAVTARCLRTAHTVRLSVRQDRRTHHSGQLELPDRYRRHRGRALARAGPRDLGDPRRAAALRAFEAQLLGRSRSRRAARDVAETSRTNQSAGRPSATRFANT